MKGKLSLYSGIFFVSATTLAYEVALTRIFSIALWYHFAFMVVSIAMLGIAASGTFLSIYQDAGRPKRLGWYGLSLSLAIILTYIISNYIPFDLVKLSWDKTQIIYIGVYYVLLGIPFFLSGLIILTAFRYMAEEAGRVYFFDLIGAAIGAVSILLILFLMGEGGTIVAISLIAIAGALLLGEKGDRYLRYTATTVALLLIFLFIYRPSVFDVRISPYKGMMVALRYPGAEHIKTYSGASARVDVIKSPAVRYAPGLSLRYLDPLPQQLGLSVDGGELSAITEFPIHKEALKFIENLPSSLPYAIGKNQDVLILEPKGGLPVLTALYYSSEHIDKVESNPIIVDVIKKDFKQFSGGIYNEDTYTAIGRAWIKKGRRYDIIDISLTGALPWEGGAYGLVEDFRFTKEAFMDYYQHLKDNGYLSITLYFIPPSRTELRLLSTIMSAMDEIGIDDGHRHMAMIRSWNTITILLKRDVLSTNDIEGVRKFALDRRFDIVYYPGVRDDETNIFNSLPDNSYSKLVSRIVDPVTRKETIKGYLFDISPTTDERPFFHHFLRFKNLLETYRLVGHKWEYFIESGYLLPIILIQAISVSILLIILPLLIRREKRGSGSLLQVLLYFLGIGLGFMFIEISIIQRFILYLDHPVYSVTIVIATILFSSGCGSLLSQKFSVEKGWKGGMILILFVLTMFYALFLKYIIYGTLNLSFYERVILSIFILAPLGFLMGMPFPMGIRYITAQKGRWLIPWAWGINGSFSVIGSILAVILALVWGFSGVMYIASAVYILAFLSLHLTGHLTGHRHKADSA